jgi:hypothetical protein
MYGKTEAGVGLPVLVDSSGRVKTAGGGKYRQAALAGRMFSVANQAACITTAALALTYTGLAVCNPLASGKNLVMCGFNYGTGIAISDATSIGIMGASTGCATATAIITIQNRLLGSGGSSAVADDAVVFTTDPVLLMLVAEAWTEATTAGSIGPVHHVDLDGSIVVPPGGYVAAYTSTLTNPACLLFGFIWEEVDV